MDLTFLGVEFHQPVLLPLLKSVQVKLKSFPVLQPVTIKMDFSNS